MFFVPDKQKSALSYKAPESDCYASLKPHVASFLNKIEMFQG